MNRWKQDWKSILKTVGTYSFYLAVMIEIMLVILDKSEFLYPFEGWTFRITFLLCFIKFLCAECTAVYTLRDNVVIAAFLILGTISYQVTGGNDLLRIILFLASCKGEDMIRCLKMVFWITLIGCTGIILLSISGIYGAATLTQDFGRGGAETRYVLGMGHPNALQCMVWMTSSLGMYLYHTKWKWFHYAWTLKLFATMIPAIACMWAITVLFEKPLLSMGLNLLLIIPGVLIANTPLWLAYPYCYSGYVVSDALHTVTTTGTGSTISLFPFIPCAVIISALALYVSIKCFGRKEMR